MSRFKIRDPRVKPVKDIVVKKVKLKGVSVPKMPRVFGAKKPNFGKH